MPLLLYALYYSMPSISMPSTIQDPSAPTERQERAESRTEVLEVLEVRQRSREVRREHTPTKLAVANPP